MSAPDELRWFSLGLQRTLTAQGASMLITDAYPGELINVTTAEGHKYSIAIREGHASMGPPDVRRG